MLKEEIERLYQIALETGNFELVTLLEKMFAERENLIKMAKVDPLTGLLNKHVMSSIRDFSVIVMCDLDGFKEVNTNYGHEGGNKALQMVASILMSNVRHCDYVIRYGGDEFLIVFTGCTAKVVHDRMESIRAQVEQNGVYPISLSIGMATNENNESLETLITKADTALYSSKNAGKNKITMYSDELSNDPMYQKFK